MRLCHPWPARVAPARCPQIVPDDFRQTRVLIPAHATNAKGPFGPFLFMAERQGFEPWNTREDVTGIPVQRLRPLGHLSINLNRVRQIAGQRRFDWNSSSALLRTSHCDARPSLKLRAFVGATAR